MYAKFSDSELAQKVFDEMPSRDTISTCVRSRNRRLGKTMHALFFVDERIVFSTFVETSLVDFYWKFGDPDMAFRVFDGMVETIKIASEAEPDVSHLSAMPSTVLEGEIILLIGLAVIIQDCSLHSITSFLRMASMRMNLNYHYKDP
ncbi:hypothetical protein C2S52_003180 [Perilla frutescens var. hirtella]|nr:hypothetical protein C2S52_003180 [Perilla frutescens var. hirtella]